MQKKRNDITKCEKCNSSLIAEEVHSHVCYEGKIKDSRLDIFNKMLYVSDGIRWYPINLRKKVMTQQPKRNISKDTDDETEPSFGC